MAWIWTWRGDLLAFIAGAVLPFAFSPYFLWPLSLLSLAALFCSWGGIGVRRAMLRGWLYGLGAFGIGVSWIVSSFQFSHIALPLAIVLMLVFVAFLALYPALVGVFVALLNARTRHSVVMLLGIPALWIVGEWLRGWLWSGFTWLQLGYAQVDGWLAGLLPLVGVYGSGLAAALIAGALANCILLRDRASVISLALLLAVVLGLAQFGSQSWTKPSGDPLSVALLQGNVPQDQKWLPSMRVPTLQRYMQMTTDYLGADLIIWPETAVPGRRPQMTRFIEQLHQRAQAASSAVLFGLPEYDRANDRTFNSVEMVGTARGLYRKRHLVPFGEFLPFEFLLAPVTELLNIRVANFSAGAQEQTPLRVQGHEFAMFICYEIVFGNEVIKQLPAAAVLVTVSNDAWFGDSMGPHQHLQMVRARALETGRDVLRATNTGITAIIASNGHVQARLAQFEAGALSGQVVPREGATPYVLMGDAPTLILAALLLLFVYLLHFRLRDQNE